MSKIEIVIAAALLAFSLAQTYRVQALKTQIAEERLAYSEAYAIGMKTARDEAAKMEEKKDEAIKNAIERNTKLASDAGAARAAADGLRKQVATANTSLAALSGSAHDRHAIAAAELLAECADEYQRVAEAADGHASDVRLMLEAWPRSNKPEY